MLDIYNVKNINLHKLATIHRQSMSGRNTVSTYTHILYNNFYIIHNYIHCPLVGLGLMISAAL